MFNVVRQKNHKIFNLHVKSYDLIWSKKHSVGATILNYKSIAIISSRKTEEELLFQRHSYGATSNITLYPKANVQFRCKKKNVTYIVSFRAPCIVIYSYNKSQRDALFLKFIW